MRCIIIYIEIPEIGKFSYEQSKIWDSISQCLEKSCKQNKDIQRLGASCWLIPLNIGLPILAEAVYLAGEACFPYRTLNIDKNEEWTNYPQIK